MLLLLCISTSLVQADEAALKVEREYSRPKPEEPTAKRKVVYEQEVSFKYEHLVGFYAEVTREDSEWEYEVGWVMPATTSTEFEISVSFDNFNEHELELSVSQALGWDVELSSAVVVDDALRLELSKTWELGDDWELVYDLVYSRPMLGDKRPWKNGHALALEWELEPLTIGAQLSKGASGDSGEEDSADGQLTIGMEYAFTVN